MCYNIQQSENPRQKGDRNGLRRYGTDGKSRVQREASQMKLPLDLSQELKKRGHRFLCKSIVGTMLFWGISMTAWFVAGSSLFRMQAHPVLFWSVFGILLVLPVLHFGLYRLVAYPEVTGMVSKLTGGSPSAGKAQGIRDGADNTDSPDSGQCGDCEVTVLDGKGKTHVFSLPRTEKTAFAREYYQVGDVVYHPRFARYPFNESRFPMRPFCLCCGHIGAAGEDKCPDCGAPLVPDRADEAKPPNAWEPRSRF